MDITRLPKNRFSLSPAVIQTLKNIFITLFALTVSLAPPLSFFILYNAEGSIVYVLLHGIIVVLCAAKSGPGTNRNTRERDDPDQWRHLYTVIFVLFQSALAVLVITIVSITSASSYAAWFSFIAGDDASSTVSYYFVLKLLIFSSFTGAAIIRRHFFTPLLLLGSVHFVLFSVMYSIPLLAAAALLSLVVAIVNINRQSRGSLSINALLALLQYMVISLIVSLAIFPILATASGGSGGTLLPDRVTNTVFRVWTDFPLAVDIPGFGGRYGTREIDGSAALSSAPVFLLHHPGQYGGIMHLRTQVFDMYENSSWRISSRFMEQENDNLLSVVDDNRFNQQQGNEPSFLITTLAEYYSSIPHLLETEYITADRALPDFRYAGPASGYLLKEPFTRGTSFRFGVNRNNAHSGGNSNTPGDRDLRYYLQVNDYIQQDVRDLARALSSDSEMKSIAAVRSYFRENYHYSLNYPRVTGKQDVVSHFITQADAGYCTQFASSMTILLRLMDIPSRYVTGFYVRLNREEDKTVVRGLHAHAWSEAWVDGRGWIVVEATPPMMPETAASSRNSTYPFSDNLTRRQLDEVFGRPEDTPEPFADGSSADSRYDDSYTLSSLLRTLLKAAGYTFGVIAGLLLLTLTLFFALPSRRKIRIRLQMIVHLSSLRTGRYRRNSKHESMGTNIASSGWIGILNYLEQYKWIDGTLQTLLQPLILRFCYDPLGIGKTEARLLARKSRSLIFRLLWGKTLQ